MSHGVNFLIFKERERVPLVDYLRRDKGQYLRGKIYFKIAFLLVVRVPLEVASSCSEQVMSVLLSRSSEPTKVLS